MDVFQYMLAGCLGGLLVANWNSFKGIRGIFECKEPKYKKWFGKRWVFKLMFFAILGMGVLSLIIQ